MTKEVNVFNLGRQPRDINDQTFEVTSEHKEIMEIETEEEFDLESEDFNLDQIVDSAVDWASSPSIPHHGNESLDITSNESTPFLELKALPENLKQSLGSRVAKAVTKSFSVPPVTNPLGPK